MTKSYTMNEKLVYQTIDEYIKDFPMEIQSILQTLRMEIRKVAPQATETIKYAMPTFFLKGNLVHFAAMKNHIGFYPSPSGIKAFEERLKPYKTSKGAIQFPLNQPIPYKLIADITAYRVSEVMDLQKNKKVSSLKSTT